MLVERPTGAQAIECTLSTNILSLRDTQANFSFPIGVDTNRCGR